jgi:hypothetical protein
MVALFSVNTAGNLFAINDWERWIFTPLTFLLAIFSLRLAIENKSNLSDATEHFSDRSGRS